MDITVPLLGAGNLFPAPGETDKYVRYEQPQAPDYARRHLKQVRQPIEKVVRSLVLQTKDMAKTGEDLLAWTDAESERPIDQPEDHSPGVSRPHSHAQFGVRGCSPQNQETTNDCVLQR